MAALVLIPGDTRDALTRVLVGAAPAVEDARSWASARRALLRRLDRVGALGRTDAERLVRILATSHRSALANLPGSLWDAECSRLLDWAEEALDELSATRGTSQGFRERVAA